MQPFIPLHLLCTHFWQLVHCNELQPTPLLQTPYGHLTAFCLTFWRSPLIITLEKQKHPHGLRWKRDITSLLVGAFYRPTRLIQHWSWGVDVLAWGAIHYYVLKYAKNVSYNITARTVHIFTHGLKKFFVCQRVLLITVFLYAKCVHRTVHTNFSD